MATYYGDDSLGAFLPGLGKFIKKVGKVTSPITTGIAKAFLPASLVNAAATLDPTARKNIAPPVSVPQAAAKPYVTTDTVKDEAKKPPIALIAAGAGVLVLVAVLMSSRKVA